MKHYKIIRYIEFNRLFELFFVSAIAAILVIRFSLRLTGFPQLAAGDLHIAHMLWGGACMMAAILGFMLFLNDDFKAFFTVLGGIGFGTFIDEIGKFITKNNNYFYQPTFAVIYVIFICLYLFYKTIATKRKYTQDEYLINAVEELKEVIIKDLDKEERAKALKYLEKSHEHNEITKFLREVFSDIKEVPEVQKGMYTRTKEYFASMYRYVLKQPWFINAIVAFFIIRSVWYLYTGIVLISAVANNLAHHTLIAYISPRDERRMLQVIGIIMQAGFTITGALLIQKSRRRAYVFFKNSVLISIFILQIFNFYRSPYIALLFTLGDLLLLSIINYMIKKEDTLKQAEVTNLVP